MQSLIILHSNDIHGRIAGLARIATLVKQVRSEHPDVPVLYVDVGDIEEYLQHHWPVHVAMGRTEPIGTD